MTQDIQKFDPAAVVDKLRERVRAMFADILPPEQLDEMIKKELAAWMTPRREDVRHNYHQMTTREVPSHFQVIVRSVFEEETKVKLKDWIATSPEWATFWQIDANNTSGDKIMPAPGARACDLMAEAMVKELPNVLQSILRSFVATTVANMRNGQIP